MGVNWTLDVVECKMETKDSNGINIEKVVGTRTENVVRNMDLIAGKKVTCTFVNTLRTQDESGSESGSGGGGSKEPKRPEL